MTITVTDYFMGRDKSYASELTDAIRTNAAETVRRWNILLDAAAAEGVVPTMDSITHTAVGSGWRPAGVNSATANAAAHSTHMTGEALDVRDDRTSRALARWVLLLPLERLEAFGLWFERPQWTPNWIHGQTRPPKSGNRFYIPSTAKPLVPALPGEPQP